MPRRWCLEVPPAFAAFGEKGVVHGQADEIHPHVREGGDIVLGNVAVTPLAPKAIGRVGTGDVAEEGVDFAPGFGAIFEQEHVAFGDQPVAEVGAVEGNGMSGGVDYLGALAVEEAGFGAGEGEDDEGRE